MFFPLATVDLDPWELVRVDVPDHPEADASSDRGSLLLAPPGDPDLPWRVEAVPELDVIESGGFVPTEAFDALAVEPWHRAGHLGQGVSVAVSMHDGDRGTRMRMWRVPSRTWRRRTRTSSNR